jgi:RimJ/RimL family protein N-acetyltransferase
LRPLRPDDIPVLLGPGVAGFTSAADRNARESRIRRLVVHPTTLTEDGVWTLAVDQQGVLVGDVQVRAPRHAFPPGVCEIGITIQPQVRGRGLGTEAVQLLTGHLHRHGWPRVQASTASDNLAMRRVLERCGYAYEGTLRGFAPDEVGSRADYVLYASVGVG